MNSYLLDTHVFVWLTSAPQKLDALALELLGRPDSKVYVSAATFWEIAQKRAAKKLSFDADIAGSLIKHQLQELVIRGVHCEVAAELPPVHKDPFDRLLVAQAQVEGFVLVTQDRALHAYNVPILRA